MRKIRWIGAVLCWTVLLALSVGSVFAQEAAQEATVKPVVRERVLGDFLEREIVCVVSEDFIKFELDSAFQSKRYTEYFELSFVPKGVSLSQWPHGYTVDVIIEEDIGVVVSLRAEDADLKGLDVVDVGVNVRYRKRFENAEEAAKYARIVLSHMESNEKMTIKADVVFFEGKWLFLRRTALLKRRGDPRTSYYPLRMVFLSWIE